MVIFHSYVSLPEGSRGYMVNDVKCWIMLIRSDWRWLGYWKIQDLQEIMRYVYYFSLLGPFWVVEHPVESWLIFALGSPKLCCLQKNQCWKRKNTSRRCRTAAGPRSTPLRSARLLFSPEKKMYNDTSRWVVVKHVRVAGSVFAWGWET